MVLEPNAFSFYPMMRPCTQVYFGQSSSFIRNFTRFGAVLSCVEPLTQCTVADTLRASPGLSSRIRYNEWV